MKKEKMAKVRLLNNGGFDWLNLSLPIDVVATKCSHGDISVEMSDLGILGQNGVVIYFVRSDYELITEEEPAQQQQTIEQLLEELAQVNADGLALENRKNELLGILNQILNPYSFRLED